MSNAAALRETNSADSGNQSVATRRFFDTATSSWMVKVFPGEYYVTKNPDEVLVTVLGSCVSACDPAYQAGSPYFQMGHTEQ